MTERPTTDQRSAAPAHPVHGDHSGHNHHSNHNHHSALARYCDVAVIGASAVGLAAARQLARRRRTVIVVDDGSPGSEAAAGNLAGIGYAEVRSYGVEVLTGQVTGVHPDADGGFRIGLGGGNMLVARRVFDATDRTGAPGDRGSGVSSGTGDRIADSLADSLTEEDRTATARLSGDEADWDHRYGGDRTWSGNPNGTLVHEVTDLAPGRALDVGAGEGADALWLADCGWTVTATDISGNALARIRAEAERRGLAVDLIHGDVNDPAPFGTTTFDLVSLQYGSFRRTPDQRGLHNLLNAVAPGGTLLVVHHDHTPAGEQSGTPSGTASRPLMYDPAALVGVDDIATALAADPDTWCIEVHDTRPRPAGAVSTHHVDDVVLRATRRDTRQR